MPGETSLGPAETLPSDGDREMRGPTGGVDAHGANEFDIRHGLAGAEAKPFREAHSPAEAASETRKEGDDGPEQHQPEAERNLQGLVERPTGPFPPSGQQGAGADRPGNPDP